MKKLIKSRKGAAMELAIGVMFLMMAFTIMLLSTSGLQNSLRVDDYEDFNEMVEVNDVGEYVFATHDKYSEPGTTYELKNEYEGYSVYRDINDTYKINKGDETVLTIVVSGGKIISWN